MPMIRALVGRSHPIPQFTSQPKISLTSIHNDCNNRVPILAFSHHHQPLRRRLRHRSGSIHPLSLAALVHLICLIRSTHAISDMSEIVCNLNQKFNATNIRVSVRSLPLHEGAQTCKSNTNSTSIAFRRSDIVSPALAARCRWIKKFNSIHLAHFLFNSQICVNEFRIKCHRIAIRFSLIQLTHSQRRTAMGGRKDDEKSARGKSHSL